MGKGTGQLGMDSQMWSIGNIYRIKILRYQFCRLKLVEECFYAEWRQVRGTKGNDD